MAVPFAEPTDQPVGRTFRALGTTCEVLVTDPTRLDEAVALAQHHLAELDQAASRFRDDSEVARLATKADEHDASMMVSSTLADYLRAALEMAELTDGLVDPTIGRAVVAHGYDADIEVIRSADAARGGTAEAVPGWRSVTVDDIGMVRVPAGTLVDLGATAKAHAADTIARRLAARFPGGYLVNLGGDIATGGDLPLGGWQVGVRLADGREVQVLRTDGAAVCTSSTQLRTWSSSDGLQRHHIVDPRTGAGAPAVWASVTVAAPSAIVANAMATAAIVLGADAPAWLEAKGVTARLDAVDGRTTYVGGWPQPLAA